MPAPKNFVGPLNWAVPIANPDGTPTADFLTRWSEQGRANAEIPSLEDKAAVSALLDLIGGDAGDMLRRGATVWDVIASPGGTSQFLRADGTYAAPPQQTVDESEIDLSDVLTNNVSATRHGFAPKLSGDDSQYLDGSGQWSVPAGGGGGGSSQVFWSSGGTFSNTSYEAKGTLIDLATDFELDGVGVYADYPSGFELRFEVWTVDSSNDLIENLFTSSTITSAASGTTLYFKSISPSLNFSAGDRVLLALVGVSGDVSNIPYEGTPMVGLPASFTGANSSVTLAPSGSLGTTGNPYMMTATGRATLS